MDKEYTIDDDEDSNYEDFEDKEIYAEEGITNKERNYITTFARRMYVI